MLFIIIAALAQGHKSTETMDAECRLYCRQVAGYEEGRINGKYCECFDLMTYHEIVNEGKRIVIPRKRGQGSRVTEY